MKGFSAELQAHEEPACRAIQDAKKSHFLTRIRVYGARTHNLREINVEIPIGSLCVITGVSGSGKSSLAFDTIFAEGRHRYLSSLSARSRELLQSIDRPDVDFIDALPPVLCVEQRMRGPGNRSTVATASDIYDFLRLLFARVGQLHCPTCGQPVIAQSRTEIVEQALRIPNRVKMVILAPIIRGLTGAHAEAFAQIVKDGYLRARVDGEIVDAAAPPSIDPAKSHDIEIVVDRLIVKDGIQSRLEESVDLALQLGKGRCGISHETESGWQDHFFSTILACATCGTLFQPIEPRSFSFNSALGACPNCHGTGTVIGTDESESTCIACEGTRLGPVSRAVLIDGISICNFCEMSPEDALDNQSLGKPVFDVHERIRCRKFSRDWNAGRSACSGYRPAIGRRTRKCPLHTTTGGIETHPARDRGSTSFSGGRGTGLSDARPKLHNAFRRRASTNTTRRMSGQRVDRGLLHSG